MKLEITASKSNIRISAEGAVALIIGVAIACMMVVILVYYTTG